VGREGFHAGGPKKPKKTCRSEENQKMAQRIREGSPKKKAKEQSKKGPDVSSRSYSLKREGDECESKVTRRGRLRESDRCGNTQRKGFQRTERAPDLGHGWTN